MRRQALEGIRVADFSWSVAGPMITKHLADHGAEVIRIESVSRPCVLRTTAPYKDDIPGVDRSQLFANYNNNKYGVTLDLNHPRGIEVAKRFVAWADIICESFTPGVMKRWGLDYDELRKIKPDIIMLSTCSNGQSGPYSQLAGIGPMLQAFAGFVYITGYPDREPVVPYGAYTDFTTPIFGTSALIAALDYRRRTGKGQNLDLSQYEAGVHFLAPLLLDFNVTGRISGRVGNCCPYAAPHGAYACQGQDEWCAIAVFSDGEWQAFRQAIGNPTWAEDPKFATIIGRKKNEDELNKLVEEWTSNFAPEQVMAIMQAAGVSAGVVQKPENVQIDVQFKHRHHLWSFEHRELGKHYCDGPCFVLSSTPSEPRMAAPCLGEHNEYVYTKILGMSDDEFVELLAEGVFGSVN